MLNFVLIDNISYKAGRYKANKNSVLILDDEASLRLSLVDFFIDIGWQVEECKSAKEALDILNTRFFDLVIVDIRLPDMDGETFMHHAHALHPSLRFVVHTGSLEYQSSSSPTPDGPNIEAVIHKPVIDMQPFLDIINRISIKP